MSTVIRDAISEKTAQDLSRNGPIAEVKEYGVF
jgi:hypothetical protein